MASECRTRDSPGAGDAIFSEFGATIVTPLVVVALFKTDGVGGVLGHRTGPARVGGVDGRGVSVD
ncbi:MAG TPA: hypothetical protein VHW66_03840 [Stellaceae bacterium]|nr:hypothetical protein [Stellaceae bacterium]